MTAKDLYRFIGLTLEEAGILANQEYGCSLFIADSVDDVTKGLESKGIYIKALTKNGIVEETPMAYKDVDSVVNVSDHLGIATKVAKLIPIGVIKG